MKSKALQWLIAASLLLALAVPAWAQPVLVGKEFQVNQNTQNRHLAPVAAFNPAGQWLMVWEHGLDGLLGRLYDRNGEPLTKQLTLVANNRLPTIPAQGEVMVRKDPALVHLPNGEFLLFWTEERDYLVLDHFYEDRTILEQDIRGQRFSANGAPLGASFLVSESPLGFQRRPKAALKSGGVMVVWEGATGWKDSLTVHGRFLTRRGTPRGDEFRVDSGQATEVRSLALAGNAAGEALVVWEADQGGNPNVLARFYDKDGAATGAEAVVHASTVGRQRRPAVVATHDGDFLVAWQSFVPNTDIHGISGQLYSSAGSRVGSERQFSEGVGEVQISPALALLPSGNIIVTWMDWIETWPIGLYGVVVDRAGNRLANEIKISEGRLYPQYKNSVAANAHGEIVTVWEGVIKRNGAIAGRRLRAN